MTVSGVRPPRVVIPDAVWSDGIQVAPYIAQLALTHGPVLALVPEPGESGGGCRVAGPLTGTEVVYLVGPEANRFVMLTHREHFSHDLGWTPFIGDALGHGLLNMDPPQHTRDRGSMGHAFSAAYMAEYLPVMHRVIADRTRNWAERGEVDLLAEAREITFDVVAQTLLGFQTGAQVDWLRDHFAALYHAHGVVEHMGWQEVIEHQTRLRHELNGTLLEVIAERRAAGDSRATDVLGMLVQARDEEGRAMTDEQLLAHVRILLVAGHETTTNLTAWLLYLLATHPEYGARVDAELAAVMGPIDTPLTSDMMRSMPVLTNAVKEAGRLQSPVMLLPRGVVSDVEFGGYALPAGTPAFLAVASTHRLPTVFADPDRFDPDRFAPPREEDKRTPFSLVTFGGGARVCLGINFANIEIMAAAAHVRRRYRIEPIPDRPVKQMPGILNFLPRGIKARVRPVS